jgi:NitT/TauT family transport system permease protein
MRNQPAAFSERLASLVRFPLHGGSLLREVPVLAGAFAAFYALLILAQRWIAPVSGQAEISLAVWALPKYALLSVLRLTLAYLLSLAFAVGYGYIAAHNERAGRFMIPLLDTLQSIPVLSFLPPVMIAMVALFPTRELGIELGSVLLIFTGQVWNMAFSFYASLKSIPAEMREAAEIYRWSRWQKFVQMELPYSTIGLLWNSMMSVAGGWFFLMACEMFVLGDRDLRLPGLGSYLQTAANQGDTRAILWGLAVMIGVIILIDQLVWRPAIAWAQKFKFEQVESSDVPHSFVLDFLRHSRLLPVFNRAVFRPARERAGLYFARRHQNQAQVDQPPGHAHRWILWASTVIITLALSVALLRMLALVGTLHAAQWRELLLGAGATFLRVELTLLLAGLWTIPVGVMIGLNPKLSAIAQPAAQVAASVPATALFPVILLLLIGAGGGLGIGSIVLLLLGTQWYILFNVIAGASAIPTDLREVCDLYRFPRWERWRDLLLPAIFPYLVTGFITASGGAWNASIVAEYSRFRDQTYAVTGLGAIISRATDQGDFAMLLGATILMAIIVVSVNRLVWRRLYRLAASRFTLEN